jgi:hypothetical protein
MVANDKIDNLLYRIVTGQYKVTYDDTVYVVKQPSFALKNEANMLYNDVLKTSRFEPWISERQCYIKLINAGLLRPDFEPELTRLEKKLESLKIDLYKKYLDVKAQRKIKQSIRITRNQHNKLSDIKSSLYSFTVKGFASITKFEYLFLHTIYTLDDVAVHTQDNINHRLLTNAIVTSHLTEGDYRELARSLVWRTHHSTTKVPFPDFTYLTDEQQQLISYSNMYDSVYKNSECPPDEVIKDDDMLDGWLLLQQKEIEDEKKKAQGKDITNKHANARDVFIMANSPEDITRINDMNDTHSKMVKQQREQELKQRGAVKGGLFLDRKLENVTKANQAFKDHVKGTK